jgi:hypothetical protein
LINDIDLIGHSSSRYIQREERESKSLEAKLRLKEVIRLGKATVRSSKSVLVSETVWEELAQRLKEQGVVSTEARAPEKEMIHKDPSARPKDPEESLAERFMLVAHQCQRISSEERGLVNSLLKSGKASFLKQGDRLPLCALEEHTIYLRNENEAVWSPPHAIADSDKQVLLGKIKNLVRQGVLRKVEGMSPFNSPVFLVAKAEVGSWRMVNCFVKLNK